MEQEKPDGSVRPLLLLLDFLSTKLVSHIVLRFICFLACAPIFFEFLTLGFQRWDLALDLLSRFIFGLYGCSPAQFFLVEGLALTSTLDIEFLPLVKDRLLLSVRQLRTIWVKPGEYCANCSLDAAFWCFLATSVDVPDSPGCVLS